MTWQAPWNVELNPRKYVNVDKKALPCLCEAVFHWNMAWKWLTTGNFPEIESFLTRRQDTGQEINIYFPAFTFILIANSIKNKISAGPCVLKPRRLEKLIQATGTMCWSCWLKKNSRCGNRDFFEPSFIYRSCSCNCDFFYISKVLQKSMVRSHNGAGSLSALWWDSALVFIVNSLFSFSNQFTHCFNWFSLSHTHTNTHTNVWGSQGMHPSTIRKTEAPTDQNDLTCHRHKHNQTLSVFYRT